MSLDRREFLKRAGAQAGLLAATAADARSAHALAAPHPGAAAPALSSAAPDVVVIGAGAFGGWTALYLRMLGANVTLLDAYGPGNSRSTSGDETRGVRTAYGERELWTRWASEAIVRWKEWDEEWMRTLGRRHFFPTGDLIIRPEWDNFLEQTRQTFDKVGVRYEVVPIDEMQYRYPQMRMEGMSISLFEYDAGVVRARQACLTVAETFVKMGGRLETARAMLGAAHGRRLEEVALAPAGTMKADQFVFACGPWFPKVFPDHMGDVIRTSMGHVFYFGTPPADRRFTWPNLPSWNVPGVTGWPALEPDNRGFRIRTGGRPQGDPDRSERWFDDAYHASARRILADRFPDLLHAPLVETRSCHYESSSTRNFIVDHHPDYDNVWIAGGGSAEGFKFGPVIGRYIAERVLATNTDAALMKEFALNREPPPNPQPNREEE